MPDAERSRLASVLDELCHAVGADSGGALYLDDGDGTLQLAASSGVDKAHAGFFDRLRGKNKDESDGRTLILRLGGSSGGMAILTRSSGGGFTQQDRAVARLYARRFTDEGLGETGS